MNIECSMSSGVFEQSYIMMTSQACQERNQHSSAKEVQSPFELHQPPES